MFRFIIKSVIVFLSLTSGHSPSIGDRTEYCHDSPVQLCRIICPPVHCLEGECAMRNDNCCSVTCNVSSLESKTWRRTEDGDGSNGHQSKHLKQFLVRVHPSSFCHAHPTHHACHRRATDHRPGLYGLGGGFQVDMEQDHHQNRPQMFEFQMLMFFLLVFFLRLRYMQGGK